MKRYNLFLAFMLTIFASCVNEEFYMDNNENSSNSGIQIIGAAEDFEIRNVGARSEGEVADSYISEMTMFVFKENGDLVQGYSNRTVVEEDAEGNPKTVTFNDADTCSSAINLQKGNPTFLVDTKSGLFASLDGDDPTIIYYDNFAEDLEKCKIYIVANAWQQLEGKLNKIKTLNDLQNFTLDIDASLDMPKKENGQYRGFPMIGTDREGVTFDLSKAGQNNNSVATIPLKKLYSKVRFTMQVNANQVVSGQTPKFEIEKVEVFNIPTKVRMGRTLDNNGKPVYGSNADDDYITEFANGNTVSEANLGDYYQFAGVGVAPFVIDEFNKTTIYHDISETTKDVIEFGFYMPEHKVTPNTITYPTNMPENLYQYYKPKGVGAVRNKDGTTSAAKIATFVRIHGTYTDHNAQIKTVRYDIYLGQNNYNNFTVKRNQQINNKLIITGLTNYHDAYGDEDNDPNNDNISIDHRVDVDYKGFNLSMERTAIMDAHFEVRPLDIELSPGSTMRITIPESYRSWIALESDAEARRTKDANTYVNTTDDRKGVRKYFTTNLVNDLNNVNNGTLELIHGINEAKTKIYRVWFYIDENPNVYDKLWEEGVISYPNTSGDSYTTDGYTINKKTMYRNCPVEFKYYGTDNDNTGGASATVTKTTTINFQQWNLWRVWNQGRTRFYDIEHEEEYLNNYASDQQYGQIQDGMPWGLDGVKLSKSKKASYINANEGFLGILINFFGGNYDSWINNMIEKSGLEPFYDFYLERDKRPTNIGSRDFSGKTFNEEIITTLKDLYNEDPDENIKVDGLTLIDEPKSAIAYCYHKNKRNESGIVENYNWFLPSIDQIEEIAMGAYDEFDQVFQKQKYWSCQPAAFNKILRLERERWIIVQLSDEVQTGEYMDDNEERARATSVEYDPTNPNANENGYVNISSGVNGIEGTFTLHFTQSGGFVKDESGYVSNTGNNKTNYKNPDHAGNLSRTEYARIRAVYRSGTK